MWVWGGLYVFCLVSVCGNHSQIQGLTHAKQVLYLPTPLLSHLFKALLLLCMCECDRWRGQVGEVKRQFCGIGSLLLPLQTLWGSSSGYQAWVTSPFTCWAVSLALFIYQSSSSNRNSSKLSKSFISWAILISHSQLSRWSFFYNPCIILRMWIF